MVRNDFQFGSFGDFLTSLARRLRLPFGGYLPSNASVYGWTILATVIGLLIGMYLATSWESQAPQPVARSEDTSKQVGQTIDRLETEQTDLKKIITQLREQIDAQQAQAAQNKTTLGEISNELDAQKMAAGVTPLKGPGLRVVLDDSNAPTIPAGDDPAFYLIHEYHLRDVVNALWQAGAEAISINGERMVGSSSIYCVGSTIMVNSTRLSPPYEISAIGDSAAMDDWVNNPAVLRELKNRIKVYGLQFKTVRSQNLVAPAFTGSTTVKYASPGTSQ